MAAHPLLSIRPATIDDVPLIRALIAELAEYERLADAAVATDDDLRAQLFSAQPAAEVLIGEVDGEAAAREDLAAVERYELGIIDAYLPAKLDEAAILAEIDKAIAATGAASAADMGKLMGVLKPALAGQADMGLVSALVKKKFAS